MTKYLLGALLAISSLKTYYPKHSWERVCIGFTASWCDLSYADVGGFRRHVLSDIDELTGYRLAVRERALERWPYTVCIGFTGTRCDETRPTGHDLAATHNEATAEIPKGIKFQVLLPSGVYDVEQKFFIRRRERLDGGPTWFQKRAVRSEKP